MPPLAAILIYAVAAAAQWQGHGSRARHAALDAALTAYPEIQAAEAGRFHWRVNDVWPRLRDEVQKRKGGLFVAADGHLALLPVWKSSSELGYAWGA